MSTPHETLAVIFDFDDTLVPDSTTLFLESKGIDPRKFWGEEAKGLVEKGFDPTLAYLQLMLDRVGDGRSLGLLKRRELHDFGKTLDERFYKGLPALFKELRATVAKLPDIEIEFYIISSGLLDVIRGSKIVRDNFKA